MRDLGRQASRAAGQIRLVVERAETQGVNPEAATGKARYHPEARTWDEVRAAADTLNGLAYAIAFNGDTQLLHEITGRHWAYRPGEPDSDDRHGR
ncbi:MAG TPA: hypothetical protein VGP02_14860 [Mycobacteriales bacterium]|nr:hypothetical protein [Mycobacteriales bacterium]